MGTGHNHHGVVIEFNETEFLKYYPEARFDDVNYQDKPNTSLEDMLKRAYHIGKTRYHFLLQQGVLSTAYFTKQSCWSYEQERRLIIQKKDIVELNSIKLLNFPLSCISALIVGCQASEETKEFVFEIAKKIGASFYEMKIGRSSSIPFFVDEEEVYTFKDNGINKVETVCSLCGEPVAPFYENCGWCSINDEHKFDAAGRNPFRVMSAIGTLDKYYKTMLDVGKKN